jgi:hypothetical protein
MQWCSLEMHALQKTWNPNFNVRIRLENTRPQFKLQPTKNNSPFKMQTATKFQRFFTDCGLEIRNFFWIIDDAGLDHLPLRRGFASHVQTRSRLGILLRTLSFESLQDLASLYCMRNLITVGDRMLSFWHQITCIPYLFYTETRLNIGHPHLNIAADPGTKLQTPTFKSSLNNFWRLRVVSSMELLRRFFKYSGIAHADQLHGTTI